MAPQSSSVRTAPAWDEQSLRDPHAAADKSRRVEAMFDAIAPTYERVNAVASFGQDARWRRRAIAAAQLKASDAVLDVCCGTGDMLRGMLRQDPPPRLLIGADFSARMLGAGEYPRGGERIQLIRADGMRLPLRDESVDVVTCAFGVRNFQRLEDGLREMLRVLRPGGRLVILEFALPDNALLRAGYRFYTERVLPRIGAWLSRDREGAYRYLPQSIRTFERRSAFLARLERCGFSQPAARGLNLGGVMIYSARK